MEIDDIFLELELYGYCVVNYDQIEPKITQNLIKSHNDCLNEKCEFKDKNYSGGFLITWNKKLKENKKFKTKYIKNFIQSKFIQSILKSNRYKKYGLCSVFATLDKPESNHIAQDPHFDRTPNLKFLLYLNDMTSDNGAFKLSPGSHNWVKKSFPTPRPPFVSNSFLKATREIPFIILDKLVPINGKAGTLIIFDTDTIHHQGLVSKGESKIIRFHFSPPGRLHKFYSPRERIGTYIKPLKTMFKEIFSEKD